MCFYCRDFLCSFLNAKVITKLQMFQYSPFVTSSWYTMTPDVKQSKKDETRRKRRGSSSSYCASWLFCICDWANNWDQMVLCCRQLTENHCCGMWTEHPSEAATKLRQEKLHESLRKMLQQQKRGCNSHMKHPPNPIETSADKQAWFDSDTILYELFYDCCFVTWSSGFLTCWLLIFCRHLILLNFQMSLPLSSGHYCSFILVLWVDRWGMSA